MGDHSFEEQVREELGGLRLKPEEQVWTNVEAALREDKKRRWLLWIILLAGVSGAGALYFIKSRDNVQSKQTVNIPKAKKPATTTQPNTITGPKADHSKPSDALIAATLPKPAKVSGPVEKSAAINRLTDPDKSKDPAEKRSGSGKDPAPSENKPVIAPKSYVATQIEPAHGGTMLLLTSADTLNGWSKQREKQTTDSARTMAQLQTTLQDSITPTPKSDAVGKGKNKKPSNWTWNLLADAGSSGYRKGISFYKETYVAAAPGNTLPGGLYSAGSRPVYNDAVSFGLAAQAMRKISRSGSVGISAGYSFYTVASAGNFSSAGAAYQSAYSSSYTSAYHFATFNLDYYTGFRIGGIDLRWRAGLGTALFLGGNPLQYDPNSNLLFRNNTLVPKLQWNAGTGIDVGFARQRFFIGPQLSWFLTKTSSVASTETHLFNAAIRAGIRLNKKKK